MITLEVAPIVLDGCLPALFELIVVLSSGFVFGNAFPDLSLVCVL
ncbi:MAG: hypothetical protein ABJN34_16695 [Litoreibacter sp.]